MVAIATNLYHVGYVAYWGDEFDFGSATIRASAITQQVIRSLTEELREACEAESLIILAISRIDEE